MKFNYLLILVFTLVFISAKGELINGPANFRIKPKGLVFMSLNDGQAVECGRIENGWYKVSIEIKITKLQYDQGYEVKKGDKLVDLYTEKIIGVALVDIPGPSAVPSTWGKNKAGIEIFGYVYKTNIRENSIPEIVLDSVIHKKLSHLQYDTLKQFIMKAHYRKEDLIKKTLPQLTAYSIYESSVVDPSPGYRLGLIFEGNDLIAVEHSRPFKIAGFNNYSIPGWNAIIIIKPPKNLKIPLLIKKISESRAGAD